MNIKYEGKLLTLYEENDKERVILVDCAMVIPWSPMHGKYIMVENYRNSRIGTSLEFPGGKIEPGEKPIDAAHRELLEETGYTGGLQYLGIIYSAPAILDSRIYVYMCEDAHFVRQQTENIKMQLVSPEFLFETHKFEDAAALACIALLNRRKNEKV